MALPEAAWGPPGPLATALLKGWGALAEELEVPDDRLQRFREENCFAAALAWSLLQLPAGTLPAPGSGPVVVWIVGARMQCEGELAKGGHWQLLAQLFPTLRFDLLLVGPEMGGDLDFYAADGAEGRVRARHVCLKGHKWARQRPGRPHFAACFNSGVGTLSLPLVRHWLETLESLLALDNVPLLLTCFSAKERKGEEFLLRQLYKAKVLLEHTENPLKPLAEDSPPGYRKKTGPSKLDEIEPDADPRACSTHIWWVQGSEHSAAELRAVTTTAAPDALKQLTASFALQGAWKGWLEALRSGSKEVGALALESLAAALESEVVAKAFGAKLTGPVTAAVGTYAKRHGLHPDVKPCIERITFAKVRAATPETYPDADIMAMIRQQMEEDLGKVMQSASPC